MRTEKAIVLGPYVEKHGEKERFRLIIKSSGKRKSQFHPTLEEARRAKARLEREVAQLDEKPVDVLITEYVRSLGEHGGYRAKTLEAEQRRLRNLFGSHVSELRLSKFTERRAEQMYLGLTQRLGRSTGRPLSPTTHRAYLKTLKRFGAWAHKAGHLTRNPFQHVVPLGRDRTGKPQLRMDELDRWLQVAWKDVQQGDDLSLAALLCLWRGLRVSEVLNRVVRDLDEGGSVLVIEQAKTRAGNRRVDIPEFLRPYVQRLREGQPTHAWLFRQAGNPERPRGQTAVHKRVRSICHRAQVPPICTHSLRGMNATLKLQAGASEDYVARSIGHTSFGMTLRHYVDARVTDTLDAQRVDAALARVGQAVPHSAAPAAASVEHILRSLSEAERAALREALRAESHIQ